MSAVCLMIACAVGALETASVRLPAGFGLHAMTVSITGATGGFLIARTGKVAFFVVRKRAIAASPQAGLAA